MKDYEILWQLINALSQFTQETVQSWLEEAGKAHHITDAKYLILRELDNKPNQSLKELAKAQMVSAPSMSIMINILVDAGYVERISDQDDRRKIVLKLTTNGKNVYESINGIIMSKLQSYVDSMSVEHKNELIETSTKLLEVIGKITRNAR